MEDENSNDNQDSYRSRLINPEEAREICEKESKSNVSDTVRPKARPHNNIWRLFPCSNKTRQWKYVNGIVVISSLGGFMWGYNFSIVAGAMLLIDDHFNLSVLWHETIVSVLVAGATLGTIMAGTLSDKFGRWKVMMTSAVLHVIASVVMALAFSVIPLMIGRIIAGLAIGMVT